jgi:hypothetical protein
MGNTDSVRFKVLMAASMKTTVFCDVAQFTEGHIRYTYCLHHQGINSPDDECSKHLRNVANLYQTTRRSVPSSYIEVSSLLVYHMTAVLERFCWLVCSLFNDAFPVSDYVASKEGVINK